MAVQRAADGSNVQLAVSDNGPGLPYDLGDRIFEPFVSNKEAGLGLGLPICRRIVEAHGGRIAAEIASDGGSAFRITFPSEAIAAAPLPLDEGGG